MYLLTYLLCAVNTVGAANKDLTSHVSVFMVEMICRYTMVAVSQQAGNVDSLIDLFVCVALKKDDVYWLVVGFDQQS